MTRPHPILEEVLRDLFPSSPCRCRQCRATADQAAGATPWPAGVEPRKPQDRAGATNAPRVGLTELEQAQQALRAAEARERDAWEAWNRAADDLQAADEARREARDALARVQVREERDG